MKIENEHSENQKIKLKSFELAGSLIIDRFVGVTGWTAGSSGPIPVRSPSGLMTGPNRNDDQPAVQPVGSAGPVRVLKPCKNPLHRKQHGGL